MGGKLFSAKRLDRQEYTQYTVSLMPRLSTAFPNTDMRPVPHYREKPDFGDLDIIMRLPVDRVRDGILSDEGLAMEHHTNGNVFSFLYNDFQVDIICEPNNFEHANAFHSYNDMGNILGRIFHKMGFKFGHIGLIYVVRSEDGLRVLEEIIISNDIMDELSFIGLNPERWGGGFDTLTDIFEYVATSSFFDAAIFDRNTASAVIKKKDKTRTSFMKLLDWMETKYSISSISKFSFADHTKDEFISMAENFFGKPLVKQIADLRYLDLRQMTAKAKLNGEHVMKLTGEPGGKPLGSLMTAIKEAIGDPITDNLLKMEQSAIDNVIKETHESWKIKKV